MRYLAKMMVVMVLAAGSLSPALARPPFSAGGPIPSPTNYPGAPKPVYDDAKSPYAMNYAEEAVQSLGFRNGHMDLFSAKPVRNDSYLPSLSGGLGGDGAMLKLQWHPGE